MKNILTEKSVVDISEERYEEYKKESTTQLDLENKLRNYSHIDFSLIQELVYRRGLETPQTMRMLEAHGGSDEKRYWYTDLEKDVRKWYSVLDWVCENEGRFDVLYICVCNPSNFIIESKKSILVYPSGTVNGVDLYHQSHDFHVTPMQNLLPNS